MSARHWAVLAFKLLGLWFAASGVIAMANVPVIWLSDRADGVRMFGTLVAMFPSLLSLVVGGLVWINAGRLATHAAGPDPADLAASVFGDGDAEPVSTVRPLEAQPLFALALAVIGVLLVVEAVPMVVYGTAMFARSRQAGTTLFGPDLGEQARIWDATARANFAAACTRLLIGVALLLGPTRLSAAYARVRKEFRGTLEDAEPPALK